MEKPSEQRGGTRPDDEEARAKGEWAETAQEGIDPHAGDHADAVTDGGPDVREGAEPDLKDAPAAAQRDR
jgi:hypothetical protein